MTVRDLTPLALKRSPLPSPPECDDKHARGTVLVVAGSGSVPGVPLLTGMAALRVGAGRVRLAATQEVAAGLGLLMPEAGIVRVPSKSEGDISADAAKLLERESEGCDALVVGPGMTDTEAAGEITLRMLSADQTTPLVADAAALPDLRNAESFAELAAARVILTPHAGEMARMLEVERSDVLSNPLGHARKAAESFQSIVVMKGATTFVALPTGAAWRHEGGVPGLATSGSGDVLAGAVAGLLGRGADPETAAIWSVHVHAEAGRRLSEAVGPLGFVASDLLRLLPLVLAGGAR